MTWSTTPPLRRVWALIYLPYSIAAPEYRVAQYEPSRKSWSTLAGDTFPLSWVVVHWCPLPAPPIENPTYDPRTYAMTPTPKICGGTLTIVSGTGWYSCHRCGARCNMTMATNNNYICDSAGIH